MPNEAGAGANHQATPRFGPREPDWNRSSPKLAQMTRDVLHADIWSRPGLSPRDRSLITVGALTAMHMPEVRTHIGRALENGVTRDEIAEVIMHITMYAGWPSGVHAAGIAQRLFDELDGKA